MQKQSECASHCNNFTPPTVYFTSKNIWATQYANATCIDCNQHLWLWKNVSHPFWQTWQVTDSHDHDINVDETKVTYKSYNPNPDYPMHLMIISLLTHKPIQYWAEAPGTCQICSKKFTMKSNYDKVKKDGQEVITFHG
jgi:hypothetical protein